MRGMLKKLIRAAVAQPWDYMGTGAPDEWEFRVSPDEDEVAVWNPSLGQWAVFTEVITPRTLDQRQGERDLEGWTRYVEELGDEQD